MLVEVLLGNAAVASNVGTQPCTGSIAVDPFTHGPIWEPNIMSETILE